MRGQTAKPDRGAGGADLRAVGHDILTSARAAVEDRKPTDAEAVHEFRKAMKRWRALLRLLEPDLGMGGRRLRIAARDLARKLSRPRDAQSALDALDDILKGDAKIPHRLAEEVRTHLEDLKKKSEKSAYNAGHRRSIGTYLKRSLRTIERWPDAGSATIVERLTRSYRRARKRIPEDWRSTAAEDLHELRRRIIEHFHQIELIFPGKSRGNQAKRLRDRLGRYQDINVLAAFLAAKNASPRWKTKLRKPMMARQKQHLMAAKRLAPKLFEEKPKAFRTRLEPASSEGAHQIPVIRR
jgi:CHAD domain-containing protein